MQTKNYLLITFLLGLFSFAGTVVLADPVVPKEFGPWQTTQVGKYMSIQIPGKFKETNLDLDEETKTKIDSMATYSLDNTNGDDYQCLATFTIYSKGIIGDLEGGAKGCIDAMKDDSTVTDFKVSRKYIHEFKIKGILLTGTFKSQGKDVLFQSVLFVKQNTAWSVLIVDATEKKLPDITKAIIDSIRIKTN